MTPYFGVWLLTDFKAHRFFPPFIPFLVKLIRKPRCPSLWHQWEVKTMYRNSWPGPTPTHHTTQSLSLFSQSIFRLAWETLPTIHKKHYVWVIKPFHTLLECVCYHQLQYRNQILVYLASYLASECPQHSTICIKLSFSRDF